MGVIMGKGKRGGRPARTQDPFNVHVSRADEALSNVSEALMNFSKAHHHSGYTSAHLGNPDCTSTKFYAAIDNLMTIQRRGGGIAKPKELSACIPPFLNWLEANGMDLKKFPIELRTDLTEGCGLILTEDIKEKEKFLQVPQELIMSTHTADLAGIQQIKAEPIHKMPSVKLAVFLLLEKHSSTKSFWKEYIDVLPRSLSLPLFWKPEEILALKGTSIYA